MTKYKYKISDNFSNFQEKDLWKIVIGNKLIPFLETKQISLLYSLSSIEKIAEITHTTQSTAKKIAATLELGRRIFRYIPEKPLLNSPLAIYRYVRDMIDQPQEMIRVVYLTTQLTVAHDEIIAIGNLNSAIVGIRELFRPAFIHNAHTLVIVHNHPSGDPKASPEDISLTKYIISAANLLSLPIQDHVIVAQNGYVSIREKHPEIFKHGN